MNEYEILHFSYNIPVPLVKYIDCFTNLKELYRLFYWSEENANTKMKNVGNTHVCFLLSCVLGMSGTCLQKCWQFDRLSVCNRQCESTDIWDKPACTMQKLLWISESLGLETFYRELDACHVKLSPADNHLLTLKRFLKDEIRYNVSQSAISILNDCFWNENVLKILHDNCGTSFLRILHFNLVLRYLIWEVIANADIIMTIQNIYTRRIIFANVEKFIWMVIYIINYHYQMINILYH